MDNSDKFILLLALAAAIIAAPEMMFYILGGFATGWFLALVIDKFKND